MFKFNLDSSKKYCLLRKSEIDLTYTYKQYATRAFIEVVGRGVYPVGGCKPEGLWYAFGREWLDFKHANLRGADDYQLGPLFELEVDTNKFIKLTSKEEVTAFHKKYSNTLAEHSDIIDWTKVASKYDGIEITPFDRWSDFYWYKTYDLASGCIWNLKSIKNIIRINKENV